MIDRTSVGQGKMLLQALKLTSSNVFANSCAVDMESNENSCRMNSSHAYTATLVFYPIQTAAQQRSTFFAPDANFSLTSIFHLLGLEVAPYTLVHFPAVELIAWAFFDATGFGVKETDRNQIETTGREMCLSYSMLQSNYDSSC